MRRALVAAAALCLPALLAAQPAPFWQAEFGLGRERVSNGLADWQQADLALRRFWAPRSSFELSARRTERYSLTDNEIGTGLALPVGEAWGMSLAASASPTHRVLPRWSLGAGAQRALADGWVVGAGLRETRYTAARTSALSFTVERYFGSAALGEWRAAATATATRLAGATTSGAGRVQLDRYFGERARLGVLLAAGREADNGSGSVLLTDVRTAALLGRWPIAERWALTGELNHTRQGDLHRRTGGRLGVQLDLP
jgi:YaiO family outer membrane protein